LAKIENIIPSSEPVESVDDTDFYRENHRIGNDGEYVFVSNDELPLTDIEFSEIITCFKSLCFPKLPPRKCLTFDQYYEMNQIARNELSRLNWYHYSLPYYKIKSHENGASGEPIP